MLHQFVRVSFRNSGARMFKSDCSSLELQGVPCSADLDVHATFLGFPKSAIDSFFQSKAYKNIEQQSH